MNNTVKIYNYNRILLHIAFWITYVIGLAFVFSFGTQRTYFHSLMNVIFDLPTYLGLTYFTNYFTVPYLIKRRKFINGISILLVSIVGFSLANLFFNNVYFSIFIKDYYVGYTLKDIMLNTVWNLSPLVIFTAIKFLRDYLKSEEEKASLLQQKQKAEVNRLRTQLYPQFLFSSLTHLERLSEQNLKSTAEGIAQLSEILSYVLYDSGAKSISVKKEFKIIESYIELISQQSETYIYTDDLPFEKVSGKKICPGQIMPFLDQTIQIFGKEKPRYEIEVGIDAEQDFLLIKSIIKEIDEDQALHQFRNLEEHFGLLNLEEKAFSAEWNEQDLCIKLRLLYV